MRSWEYGGTRILNGEARPLPPPGKKSLELMPEGVLISA
jgi:hypothetical protein